MTDNNVVLSVRDVSITYLVQRGRLKAVSDVSFDLHRGETLALIGESACGKSTLNLGLMRLLPRTAKIEKGQMLYSGRDAKTIDILKLNGGQLRRFRWKECAMVFQAALNSLNPVIRIQDMVYDTAKAHGETDMRKVRARILDLFQMVRLDPERVFKSYPHELSGGMRQRVLIALSVLLDPQVLLLDEPTTALDILTQRVIMDILKDLRRELGLSIIFISHDLAIAAELADTVATMYAGNIVEIGPVEDVFYRSRHAYSYGLLQAVPRLSSEANDLSSIPGKPPDLVAPPTGCKFHERCAFAVERCQHEIPLLTPMRESAHLAACFESDRVYAASQRELPTQEKSEVQ
jgi:peptide/nickel transport system ATP-binding protein